MRFRNAREKAHKLSTHELFENNHVLTVKKVLYFTGFGTQNTDNILLIRN